jgi:hypothetical protein
MKYLYLAILIFNFAIVYAQHKEIRSKTDWCALSKDEKVKHSNSPFRCDETTKCDCSNQCDTEPDTCDVDEKPEGLNK